MGVRVEGLGFGGWGLGTGVWGLGFVSFGVLGVEGSRDEGFGLLGFWVKEFRVRRSGLRGFRV